jgi:hypothetical protein
MQRLAPESALKTGRYDVFAKKDIPASTEPGYRRHHKNPGGGYPEEHRKHRGNTQGNKNKSRRPWKREWLSARRTAFAAIITGANANTGGGLHRFFERARYFHDARNSGMMAALSPSPADFLRIRLPPGGLRHVNGVKTGDIPC